MSQTTTPLVRFRWRVRVYWEDTDAGGVVFYANYLKFFERGRTEWLRSLGVSQQGLREDTGAIFIVTDTAVRYQQPARLDDVLEVTVCIVEAGKASLVIEQTAVRVNEGDCAHNSAHNSTHNTTDDSADDSAGPVLASGRIRIGCVDGVSFRPRRIPPEIFERLLTP